MKGSIRLLMAMNGIPEETIRRTQLLLEDREEQRRHRRRIFWRTALLAAVIAGLFSVTAYAVSRFSMSGRAGMGETFEARFGNRNVEWPGEYVFEFEGPTECRKVRFKADWAPSEDYWGFIGPEEDGWATLLEATELYQEDCGVYVPACVVDVMYAPKFVDGGAMILMGLKPGEITRESWGEVQVYKFEATSNHAIDKDGTVFLTGNFVILFHPEQGWIIGVRGYDSMENMEKIARNLQVQQLDETIRSTDFENKVEFCDMYVG